jgi:2-oxoglutarate dehydrogenase E2 component (dihydrolipoamide succinyltransferase)
MPTDIIMPQMGESIVEGTITKWLKKPGDKVQRDEPLFEISTDKVDAEIPAPASGVLHEIKVTEGTTVNVNTVVGTIAVDGEAAAKPAAPAPVSDRPAAAKAEEKKPEERKSAATPSPVPAPVPHDEEEEARSSPLVRKIAREHGINLSQISGTGLGGRITKQDITSFIEGRSTTSSAPAPATQTQAPAAPRPRPPPPHTPAT